MAEPHYAARALRIGDEVLLYSRGPARRELGLPMRLEAAADGSLCALYWEGLANQRGASLANGPAEGLRGAWQRAGEVLIATAAGEPAVAGWREEARCLDFSARMVPGVACRAGIGVSDGSGEIVAVLDCELQEASIERLHSGETLASVPWDVVPVQPVELRLLADREVLSLYVDDEFAASACVDGRGAGAPRIAVVHGSAEFRALTAHDLRL
jgi:hypothetical protein